MGNVTREDANGGLIGLLEDGDKITIDALKGTIDADLTLKEIEKRKKNWKNPKPVPKKGVLAKYAKTVQSASEGAVTD